MMVSPLTVWYRLEKRHQPLAHWSNPERNPRGRLDYGQRFEATCWRCGTRHGEGRTIPDSAGGRRPSMARSIALVHSRELQAIADMSLMGRDHEIISLVSRAVLPAWCGLSPGPRTRLLRLVSRRAPAARRPQRFRPARRGISPYCTG